MAAAQPKTHVITGASPPAFPDEVAGLLTPKSTGTRGSPRLGARRVREEAALAELAAGETAVKKLKSDTSVKVKKPKKKTKKERLWAAAQKQARHATPLFGTYDVVNDGAPLPSEHKLSVDRLVHKLSADFTNLAVAHKGARVEKQDGSGGYEAARRATVVDIDAAMLTDLEDRHLEFTKQIQADVNMYQLRAKPLPRTENVATVNRYPYHAPLGRIPVLGAKFPPVHLSGRADKQVDVQPNSYAPPPHQDVYQVDALQH